MRIRNTETGRHVVAHNIVTGNHVERFVSEANAGAETACWSGLTIAAAHYLHSLP